ncbi:3',5'-cyclic-nucleotide phosphodiesterase [Polyrhizophydium stewartii]|uniref:Phosphodiesterase n=1 Tax=Polyrhizophydium stewartii TaxID=2732419 RepID=A0ABR4NF04_9FUNG
MKFDEWAVRRWLDSHPEQARTLIAEHLAKHGGVGQTEPGAGGEQLARTGSAQAFPRESSISTGGVSSGVMSPGGGLALDSSSSHHYELIFDIAKMVYSSLDLQTVVESVLSIAVNLVSAERCSLFLLDKATNELYTLAFDVRNMDDGDPQQQQHHALALGQNPVGIASPHLSHHHSPGHGSRSPMSLARSVLQSKNSALIAEDIESIERTRHFAEEASKNHKPNPGIRIPVGSGVAGYVALTRQGLNIRDAYSDPRFNPTIDRQTGFKTNSILCLPIFGPLAEDGQPELVGVASLVNKTGSGPIGIRRVNSPGSLHSLNQSSPFLDHTDDHEVFTEEDTFLFKNLLVLVGIAIKNSKQYELTKKAQLEASELAARNKVLYETARQETEKGKVMLQLADTLYREDDTKELIRKIIVVAKDLMGADKASFFTVNMEKQQLHSSVFDSGTESSFVVPLNKGIAGYVASSGQIVNLRDAYTDERFNPEVDVKTNYRTRSMLSVPVPSPKSGIVGVANLINKLPTAATPEGEHPYFSEQDEAIFSSFAVFCGLALHKTMMLEELEKQRTRLALMMEIMSFHATVREDEAQHMRQVLPNKITPLETLRSIMFDPHVFPHSDEALAAVTYQMFLDLAYGTRYEVPNEQVLNYILTVRKNYRPVAYHNFTHAVSVTHAFYTLVISGALDAVSDLTEQFAMFVACLNHDIDHRGTNNQFQKQAHTELASFYSTSTMERHHFNHAMMILSQGTGINILQHLNTSDYEKVLKVIESSILATDLGMFFGNRGKVKAILDGGTFDRASPEHRELVRGVIMTCCDLGAMFKPWEMSRKTADSVYEEFFQQGDEEKRLGMRLSGELMDRAKMPEIPRMQLDFYNFVVTPAFEQLFGLLGEPVKALLDAVMANRAKWKELKESGVPYKFGMDV